MLLHTRMRVQIGLSGMLYKLMTLWHYLNSSFLFVTPGVSLLVIFFIKHWHCLLIHNRKDVLLCNAFVLVCLHNELCCLLHKVPLHLYASVKRSLRRAALGSCSALMPIASVLAKATNVMRCPKIHILASSPLSGPSPWDSL